MNAQFKYVGERTSLWRAPEYDSIDHILSDIYKRVTALKLYVLKNGGHPDPRIYTLLDNIRELVKEPRKVTSEKKDE